MIAIEFRDLMEMKNFAKELLGIDTALAQASAVVSAPVPEIQPAQVAPPIQYQTPMQPAAPQAQYQATTAPAAPPMAAAQYQAPAAQVAPPNVPTTTQSYTADDLARAAMTLMDSGRQGDLLQLLSSFGVASLPALQPGQYGAFATALRGMGAHI